MKKLRVTHSAGPTCKINDTDMFPLQKVGLNGKYYWGPANPENQLKQIYGNTWRSPPPPTAGKCTELHTALRNICNEHINVVLKNVKLNGNVIGYPLHSKYFGFVSNVIEC